MYDLFCNQVTEKRAQIDKALESVEIERELAEMEIEEATKKYQEKLARFHQLMDRAKQHGNTTPRITQATREANNKALNKKTSAMPVTNL